MPYKKNKYEDKVEAKNKLKKAQDYADQSEYLEAKKKGEAE